MESKELIKKAIKVRGTTQEELAKKMGYTGQTNVSGIINRNSSMRVNSLVNMLNHLGYDIYVFDKETGEKLGKITDKPKTNKYVKKEEVEVKEAVKEPKTIPVFQYGR